MARTAKAGQQPIVVHQGVNVFVGDDGEFWCDVEGEQWKAQALKVLKTRLDDHARRRARAKVANLELALAQRKSSRWQYEDDADGKVTWTVGTYVGLNAHTGDVKLKLKSGEIEDISYGLFFRADDAEGRAAYTEAVKTERDAKAAHEQARKATHKVEGQYGHRVNTEHRYDMSKAEAAAAAEEKFVAALTKGAA